MTCPNCGAQCECDSVDIGVGEQQVGPYFCTECQWSEDNRIDFEPSDEEIFQEEKHEADKEC